jgi:predicted RNase H-like HicB family nuclease
MEIDALIHKAEEGGYWAEVPSMPGCVTQGETLDEIVVNLAEAAGGWLATSSDEPQY